MKHTLHNLLGFAPQIVWGGGDSGGGGGSDDKPKRRPSGGKGTAPTVKSTASSLATDIKMGLSTFGQSKDQQAQTLRDKGYSERAIQSYQERTEASKARAAAMSSSDNDSGSSTTTTTDTSTDTDTDTDTTTSTDTTTNLDTDTNTALTNVETISTDTFTNDADFTGNVTSGASVGTAAGGVEQYEAAKETSVGQAEDEALELMKKGRRATILTKPGGLLGAGTEEGQTRRRRSLIGG